MKNNIFFDVKTIQELGTDPEQFSKHLIKLATYYIDISRDTKISSEYLKKDLEKLLIDNNICPKCILETLETYRKKVIKCNNCGFEEKNEEVSN